MRQVVIYPGEDGYWVAECPSLLGCISQGKTKQEAVTNIKEAIEGYIVSLEEDELPVPEEHLTPVALERVVDRRVFRPTLRTRTSCPRGEGAVEIDPARLGIEGHANDLSGSRKAERKGKQRQRVHDENLRRLAWRRVRAYRRKEGHKSRLGADYPTRWETWRYSHQTQESPLGFRPDAGIAP